MTPGTDLDPLRQQLGLTDAPVVRANLAIVAGFFEHTLRESPLNWISYLKGIDFSQPAGIGRLRPGQEVIRYLPPGARFKPFTYFTEVGTSPMRTGTNFPETSFERYEVVTPIETLFSIASWISFGPEDRTIRPGGARQFIIPTRDLANLRRK